MFYYVAGVYYRHFSSVAWTEFSCCCEVEKELVYLCELTEPIIMSYNHSFQSCSRGLLNGRGRRDSGIPEREGLIITFDFDDYYLCSPHFGYILSQFHPSNLVQNFLLSLLRILILLFDKQLEVHNSGIKSERGSTIWISDYEEKVVKLDTRVQVRTNNELKHEDTTLLSEMCLDLTMAVNMLLR